MNHQMKKVACYYHKHSPVLNINKQKKSNVFSSKLDKMHLIFCLYLSPEYVFPNQVLLWTLIEDPSNTKNLKLLLKFLQSQLFQYDFHAVSILVSDIGMVIAKPDSEWLNLSKRSLINFPAM